MNKVKVMFGLILLLAAMALAAGSESYALPTYKAYAGKGAYELHIGESVKGLDSYSVRLVGMSAPTEASALSASLEIIDPSGNTIKEVAVREGESVAIGDGKNSMLVKINDLSNSAGASGAYAQVAVSLNDISSQAATGIASAASQAAVSIKKVGTSTTKITGSSRGVIEVESPKLRPYPEDGDLPPSPPEESIPQEGMQITYRLNSGWNLISFPYYWLVNPECTGEMCPAMMIAPTVKVIENTCDSNSIWHYEAYPTLNYRKYDLGSYVNPQMHGYWFRANSDCTLTIQGNNEISPEGMALAQGWNHIGAPAKNVLFDKISGDCSVTSGPWRYNSAAKKYEKSEVLKPGEGYFVRVNAACTLGSGSNDDLPPFPDDVITPTPYPTSYPKPYPHICNYPVRPTNILNKETIVLSKGETRTVFGTKITLEDVGPSWVQIRPVLGNVRQNSNPGMRPEGVPVINSGTSVRINLNEEAAMRELYNYFKPTQVGADKATIDVYFKASSLARQVLHRTMRSCADNSPILDEYGRAEQMFTVGEGSNYGASCQRLYQEQCIEDGSFDKYYDEWCECVNVASGNATVTPAPTSIARTMDLELVGFSLSNENPKLNERVILRPIVRNRGSAPIMVTGYKYLMSDGGAYGHEASGEVYIPAIGYQTIKVGETATLGYEFAYLPIFTKSGEWKIKGYISASEDGNLANNQYVKTVKVSSEPIGGCEKIDANTYEITHLGCKIVTSTGYNIETFDLSGVGLAKLQLQITDAAGNFIASEFLSAGESKIIAGAGSMKIYVLAPTSGKASFGRVRIETPTSSTGSGGGKGGTSATGGSGAT